MFNLLQEGITLNARHFSSEELVYIREFTLASQHLSRSQLALQLSRELSWFQANGNPKANACLRVLERLESQGFLELPPLRKGRRGGCRPVSFTMGTDPGRPLQGSVGEYFPISVEPVDKEDEGLWKEYVARYHYLGYQVGFGAQQKYFIWSGDSFRKLLGCLSFSASAWSLSSREEWIGWDRKSRGERLHLIVNNSRFLIFPWVRIRNLASKALSLVSSRLPYDWHERHGYVPVLLETFVDSERFSGASYRAANWIHLGRTAGRGRMDRENKAGLSVKDIYVFPLFSDFREILVKGGNHG